MKGRPHLHFVGSFSYRKGGCVDIKCAECGKEEMIGVWYQRAPKGWNQLQWPRLRISIEYFLTSLEDRFVPKQLRDLSCNEKIKKAVLNYQATWDLKAPTADFPDVRSQFNHALHAMWAVMHELDVFGCWEDVLMRKVLHDHFLPVEIA